MGKGVPGRPKGEAEKPLIARGQIPPRRRTLARDAKRSVVRAERQRHLNCRSRKPPSERHNRRMTLELSVLYTLDDNGWWVAEIPEIPGAHSHAPTKEEARERALDAARELSAYRSRAATAAFTLDR